ncbi:MAG TPA: helix-turn-helix domain-containing protein [Candidatus Acidoferrales bacterium]|nr:helix-turn-helix domain-containing protein [Candidatus Acidoferrales bacterium]
MSSGELDKDSTHRSAEIGSRLRQVREEKGLTQEQVADLLQAQLGESWGKNPKSKITKVQKWEAGIHRPKHEVLEAYSAIFGKPVQYFYGDTKHQAKVIKLPDPLAALDALPLKGHQKEFIRNYLKLSQIDRFQKHLEGQIDLLLEALENMERKKASK